MPNCPRCNVELPEGCFRKHRKLCTWCDWASMEKRAKYRYRDKKKGDKSSDILKISEEEFVLWYTSQPDRCSYCGLTFDELRLLRLPRGGKYYISWDIDRINPTLGYECGNLALACYVCNMAKGEVLNHEETLRVGGIMRAIWNDRLAILGS